jgi:hypothetical protein
MANDGEDIKKEEFTNQLVDEIKIFGSEFRKYRASCAKGTSIKESN